MLINKHKKNVNHDKIIKSAGLEIIEELERRKCRQSQTG